MLATVKEIFANERVAVPLKREVFCDHFGAAEQFAIYVGDMKEPRLLEKVDAPPHEPGSLPRFLLHCGVDHVVVGTIGERALLMLADGGVRVHVAAAVLPPDELARACLNGELLPARTGAGICAGHHHDDPHRQNDNNCGH